MSGRHEPSFTNQETKSAHSADGAALTLAPIAELLTQHAAIISRIRLAAGITNDEFDGHYMRGMRAYAAYVQTLPATRSRHHTGHGGMLAYGLETAFLALQIAGNKIFSAHEPVETRSKVETRWRLAAFLTGLFADIGMVTGLVVYAKNGERWEPLIEPLTSFANRHDVEAVLHHWRSAAEPDETEYRVYSGLILPRLLDQEQLAFLLEGGRHIVHAMSLAVSGQVSAATTNTLLQSIDEARTATIAKDERSRGQKPMQASLHLPLHQYLLDAIRRLARSRWTVNAAAGPLWKTSTGAYLYWAPVAQAATEMLCNDGLIVPRDPDTLAEILAEHGVLIRSPSSGHRQSMYWQCRQPDGSTLPCIRVEPAKLGVEDELDVDLKIEPDPNPIVMSVAPSSQRTSVQTETGNANAVATMVDAQNGQTTGAQHPQPADHQFPGQCGFDFNDEGPEGIALLVIANDIVTGKVRFEDVAMRRDDTLALRYPDAIALSKFNVAHMVEKMGQANWLVRPTKGKGWLFDAEGTKWGKAKFIVLDQKTTKRFLDIAGATGESTQDTANVVREDPPTPEEQVSKPGVITVNPSPAPGAKMVNTHTILEAIEAAFRDGEFEGQTIEVITKGEHTEYVRMPFPLTYDIAAKRLKTTLEDVSQALSRGPAVITKGGHAVRRGGDDHHVMFSGLHLKSIANRYRVHQEGQAHDKQQNS
jgi:hypothetical protein